MVCISHGFGQQQWHLASVHWAPEAREEPVCRLSFGSSLALQTLGEQWEPSAWHGQCLGQRFKERSFCFGCLVTCLLLDVYAEQEVLVLSPTSARLSPAGFML